MASTYSTNLALELIGNGDQSGTWGTTTNTNLGTLIEQAISGYTIYTATGGTDAITIPYGASGTARNMYIQFNGTGGGTVEVPANKKLYFVYNNTSSAITVKVSGQTGVSVPAAAKMILVCNGTDVVVATNYLAALTLGAALPVASGGTGATTLTGYVKGNGTSAMTAQAVPIPVADGGTGLTSVTAYNVVVGNSAGTGYTTIAPGSSGNVLKSDGTQWTSASSAGSGSITASGYTQNTNKLLGRTTAGSGAIEEISVGSGLSLSAGSLSSTGGITAETPVSAATKTYIEFTGIPAGVKRVTIIFNAFSSGGNSDPISVQIGPSGGVETSGYVGSMNINASSTISTTSSGTTSFGIRQATGASEVQDGTMVLTLVNSSTNTWVQTHVLGRSDAAVTKFGGGSKSISGSLSRIKIFVGSDTLDGGQVNIFYE